MFLCFHAGFSYKFNMFVDFNVYVNLKQLLNHTELLFKFYILYIDVVILCLLVLL